MRHPFLRLCALSTLSTLAALAGLAGLAGCPAAPGPPPDVLEEASAPAPRPAEATDDPLAPAARISQSLHPSDNPFIDGFRPTPLGAFLDGLDDDGAAHLFPNLPAPRALADSLAARLPAEVGGEPRHELVQGVVETATGVGVAALASYGDPPVHVGLIDTAWEAGLLNGPLSQRREDRRAVPAPAPGHAVLAPASDEAVPRLWWFAHGDLERAAEIDALVDRPPVAAVALPQAWPRPSRVPASAEQLLARPDRLAAALPVPGDPVLSRAHGYRVGPYLAIQSEALVILGLPGGVAVISLQDAGPADRPLFPDGLVGPPQEVFAEGPGGLKCSELLASCKLQRPFAGRALFSVVWPLAAGRRWGVTLADRLDGAALEAELAR
jgi:hypothetical protein